MIPIARTIGLVASVALHAGVAAGVAFGSNGHVPEGTATTATFEVETIPVDPPPVPPVPPVAPAAPPAGEPALRPLDVAPPRRAVAAVAPPPSAPERSSDTPSSPSIASAEPPMPRFTITLAGGASGSRASLGAEATAGPGERSALAEAPPLPASAAHVRAQLIAAFPAAYPSVARSDGIEGEVPLEIVLGVDGRVVDARVVRAAGNGFDASALAAVRRYRFTPAERDGRPIRVRMPWTVQFRLK